MTITTKVFGEVSIDDDKIIHFPGGIIGFPDLTDFAMLHDEEDSISAIHWLQSIQEPAFAMPVMDPLIVKEDYNPEVDDELLKPLGELTHEETLVLVTLTVPQDLTKMTCNLKAPIIINADTLKGCHMIADNDEYVVKYPIYDIIKSASKKGGE